MEQPTSDGVATANEVPTFHSRVGVTVTPYRCTLTDTDGIAAKAAIDALVHYGVIKNDTGKEIAWVKYEACIKVKNKTDEKTVIVIEEV